jgi:hypothetical protein
MKSPNELIEQYKSVFSKAHPGHDAPVITFDNGSFRFKERGEHLTTLSDKDLAHKCNELVKLVNNREFDLSTLSGLAAATDQAYRASQVYFREHIAPRLNAVTNLEEFKALKSEICMGCAGPNGFMLPLPPEFDLHFMMKLSDLKHFAREADKAL